MPGHPRLCARRRSKTWMAGTSPAMTKINFNRCFLGPCSWAYCSWAYCHVCRHHFKAKTLPPMDRGRRSVGLDRQQVVQPRLHRLVQIVSRPAERGIALGEKGVLLALQGAAGARTVARGPTDHLGVHRVDLAVEIGKLRIGADRLFDRASGGGAIEAWLVVDRH